MSKTIKCPVCGCKMRTGICPYCKVTDKEVTDASNRDAKVAIRARKREYIHYTNTLPSDVSRKKLFWYSLFFGWTGAENFYVGKYVKAWYSLIVSLLVIIMSVLFTVSNACHWVTTSAFYMIIELLAIPMVVVLFFWFTDVLGVITKSFRVPILLQGKENK